jgi:hypothetical protein
MSPNIPTPRIDDDRGRVQLVDVILTFFALVAILVTSPYWTKFTGMMASEADPFTRLLLQLAVPLLLIALLLSVGVSARA